MEITVHEQNFRRFSIKYIKAMERVRNRKLRLQLKDLQKETGDTVKQLSVD